MWFDTYKTTGDYFSIGISLKLNSILDLFGNLLFTIVGTVFYWYNGFSKINKYKNSIINISIEISPPIVVFTFLLFS